MRKRLIERIVKSKKGSPGYTLTELLTVIGIIAVVCAIAIPSIFAIRNALRFAQANNYAKSIFLAAQQNLTEMRSDGGLGPVQSINNSTTAISEGHCGFPDSEWSDEYVFTASNSSVHAMGYGMVLPANSVEATVRNEQVIIEYNPITGNVYAVFFCDDDDVDLLGTYMDNQLPRDKAGRKALMVGYYDGSGLSSTNLEVEQSQAQVMFTNGEEAMVTIRIPMPSQYYNKQNIFEEGLKVKLTIRGESSWGGSMEVLAKDLGLTDNCTLDTNGNTMLVTFALDSLADFRSFANLSTVYAADGAAADVSVSALTDQSFVRGENILPGDNVTIQAVVTFENEDGNPAVEIEPGILAGINPMFDYLLPSPTEEGKYILAVSNGRNLQNLNAIHPEIADSVTGVVFTEDINWNSTVSYYNNEYGTSGTYENAAAEAPARSLPYFVPIQNENLFGTAEFIYMNEDDGQRESIIISLIKWLLGQSNSSFNARDRVPTLTDELDTRVVDGKQIGDTHATIDGQGYKVSFLNIDATRYTPCADTFYALGDNQTADYYFAGLFGYANTTINDLHVVNPIIKGHNFVNEDSSGNKIYMDPATGALLGAGGYNTLVTNCSTYLDTSMEGFNWAYAGSAAQDYYDASSVMDWYGVSGEGAVGGLVGYAKSHRTVIGELGSDTRYLAFSNSFAAVPVSGTMRGNQWKDSQGNPQKDYGYSNGVGGFIGNSQLTNFYNCYASGNVMAMYTYHASAGWQDNAATYLGLGGNGRLAMGAGGFVGTSHGTRYTNCFSAGNVINGNRNDTTGGFVGMMCYDATKSYGHHSDSVTSAQIAQHTVFDSCYAIGMCTNKDGLYLENFSGANGKIVASYGNLKTYYTGDYYKLLAPYAMTHNYNLPPYDDLYIFKDSYYLSQYKGTTGVSQDASNKCAEPITYDELVKLQEKYDDEEAGGWISEQVDAIKKEPLDYDDILPVVQEVLSEIFSLSLQDIISGFFGDKTENMLKVEHILETLANDRNFNIYFVIDSYRQNKLESIYTSRYSEGFPSPPWENAAEATTHYYGEASAGKVYPFPKLVNMDYYGLWPEKTLDAGLAYFEVYDTEDGLVTGYYFDREDTSQLKNYADAKVVSDGYVIFTANANDVIDVRVNGDLVANDLMPDNANTVTMQSVITPDSNSYYVATLPKLALDAAPGADGNYYYKMELTITNGSNAEYIVAYFNPNTGLSQVNSSTRPTMLPSGISIRSARQLTALTTEPLLWGADYNFVQHMNIDAKSYTAHNYSSNDKTAILNEIAAGGSIGSKASPFLGSYTGRGYAEQAQIVDFKPGVTNDTAGIFGTIGESGLVDCLEIRYTDTVTTASESTGSTGILAGISSGTIQQIDMILEKNAQLTADSAAGLLAGTLNGIVKDITITTGDIPETADAAVEVTADDALTITAQHAGLAIGNGGNAVTENVSVTQKDLVDETAAVTVGYMPTADYAGGFAGSMTDSTIKNVTVDLSTMSADANAAAGFAGRLNGGSVTTVTVNLNTALANTRIPEENEAVYAAGLVGTSDNVEYAQSTVVMNGSITGSSVAGMFGSVTHGKVQNAQSILNGTVNGTIDAAGFAVVIGEGDGVIQNTHTYLQINDSKILAGERAAGFAVEQGGTTLGTTVRLGTYGASNKVEASGTIEGGTQAAGYACIVTGAVNSSSVMGAADITATSGTAAGFTADVSGSGSIANSGVTPAMGDQTSHYRFNSNNNLMISGSSAAGFAANVANTASVVNSYVLGTVSGTAADTEQTAPTHAGFVLTNDGAVTGSTANITIAGGHAFAGTNNGTVSNCYGWYGDGKAENNTSVVVSDGYTGAYTGSYFVDIDVLEGEDDTGVNSVVLFDYEGTRKDMMPSELASALSLLNKEGAFDWYGPATYAAKPYSSITPATYSYPMLRTHYGDWVTKPLYAYGVMYYEVDANGNWTYNIVDLTDPALTIEDGDLSLNTLKFEDTTTGIADAGYAVFCRTTDDPNSLFAGNKTWISKTAIALADDSGNATAFRTQVYAPFLENVKDKKDGRYSFYKIEAAGELTFDGSKDDVSVVTWFANAIDVAGTAAAPYIIRTPGQFANIVNKSASSFVQMHTLDAETFATIPDFTGTYDGNNLALTVKQGNTWMNTLTGSVSNVYLTVDGNVTAPVIGTVAGAVTLTDPITVTGSIDANAALFGAVTGNVTTAAISVIGDVNGSLMNSVSGSVTTGAISTGNVTGTLIGAVNESQAMQTGAVSVMDISGSGCWLIGTVTDSAVTLGSITADTSHTDTASVTTYNDVSTMIDTVTGTSTVIGGSVNLGSAALAQNLVSEINDGASVQSFAVQAGSLKTSLIGTVSGTAANGDTAARKSTISGISVTAGDSPVFSGSGLLVNTLGTDTAVNNCSVQAGTITLSAADMAEHKEGETPTKSFGGITGVIPAGVTISGNTVDADVNVTGQDNMLTVIGGVAAINRGTISGGSATVNVTYTQTAGTTETPDDMVGIGGLVGWMRPGSSITGTAEQCVSAAGSINLAGEGKGLNRDSYFVGGAVAYDEASADAHCTYSYITTNVAVSDVWAGTALVAKDTDTVKVNVGKVNPSGKGTVGKFVGYVSGGAFTECDATSAVGSYQFVGEIQANAQILTNDNLYISNTVSTDTTIDWDKEPTEEDLLSKGFTKVQGDSYIWYTYLATLNGCTFAWSDGNTYNQTFGNTYIYGNTLTPRDLYKAVNVGAPTYNAQSEIPYSDFEYYRYSDGSDTNIETSYYYLDEQNVYRPVYVDYSRSTEWSGSWFVSYHSYSLKYKMDDGSYSAAFHTATKLTDPQNTKYTVPTLYTKTTVNSFPSTEKEAEYMIVATGSNGQRVALTVNGTAVAFTETFDKEANPEIKNAIWLTTGSQTAWKNLGNSNRYLRLSENNLTSNGSTSIHVNQQGTDASGNTTFRLYGYFYYLGFSKDKFVTEYHSRSSSADAFSIYKVIADGKTWGSEFDRRDEIDYTCIVTDSSGTPVELSEPVVEEIQSNDLITTVTGFAGDLVEGLVALLPDPFRKVEG